MIPGAEVSDLLVSLIQNACVNDGTPDSGGEERSVATLTEYLGEPDWVFEPHPTRASAVWSVPGRDADAPSLMLMGHTDVVPAARDGWSVDPFAGERRDGFIWGRGAVDMLNQTAAMAAVFSRHRLGEAPRLPGELMFLAVADEESGGRLGARPLVEEHWDQVACDYLLTEIGTPLLEGSAGPCLPVTVAEKGPQWRVLRSSGVPGHGSQPYGTHNALVPMADAISRLAATPPPAAITDEWRRFVEAWDPPDGLAEELLDVDRIDDAIDRIAISDTGLARWIHACTHLTISPNTLRAGVKANVVPDRAVAEIDIRSLPGQDEADVLDHFRKAIGPGFEEIEVETIEATRANGSAPEGPLWQAITEALAGLEPGAHPVPAMIPVGTDARFFRRRGTVAYGVSLFDRQVGFGDFLKMFHGHDERVSEESLRLTTELTRLTVERFGSLSA
ncbi:MAG TPA: M20/M25/M40 family metallo-hydrolase [Acidimicrobiia bacterium]|nr:M20/M25/M40 family metallo-hydrolase [Acidimicrobiia bacterium]